MASSTWSIFRPVLAEIGTASRGIHADHILDLLLDPVGLGGGQVDLVEDRHNLQPGINRLIDIGQGLGLHALAGIHHQQRAFAGRQAAADFIAEVHMTRRVHQVQDIVLAVRGLVIQPHGLGLDGDAALALDIHRIEHLSVISRLRRPPVTWISRSARVDLPWSIWATMEKLRIWERSVIGLYMAYRFAA